MTMRFNAPPMHVKHSGLISVSDDSIYKKNCPVCNDGMLLVTRNQKTLELSAEDRCILCGQTFIYDDIEEMRKREGG